MPGILEGRTIQQKWAIPGSTDRLVFLEAQGRFHDENLVRVTDSGELVWRAELPQTGDWWVECRFEAGAIYANSWSSYLVRVDLASGEALAKTFTK